MLLLIFAQKSVCQEYKEIYIDDSRGKDIEIHIFLSDFSLENAGIVFDEYIDKFKHYKEKGKRKSLNQISLVFWDEEFSKEFIYKVIKFQDNPPTGTRSIYASYIYSIDTKYIDKKIETYK